MNRLLVSAMLPLVIAGVHLSCSAPAGRDDPLPMAFGVLGSSCSLERVTALREAGVSVVELPLGWDRYEPTPGQVDSRYVAQVRARLENCKNAGMKVILSPGLHYPPDWVKNLRGGVLRGSAGGTPASGGAELIFSAEVRAAAGEYLSRVVTDFGFDGIAAVRVGTDDGGELGYPGPREGGNDREFWAFGDAPQHGVGLAEGVMPSPMPGWRPGSPEWNESPVTEGQVRTWWDWYVGSAVGAVAWQIGELRKFGYDGRIHVPVAGRGVLPDDKAEALEGRLDGRANPDGAQERGLDYAAQFEVLSAFPRVDVDFTGLDDVSDVKARATVPPQDRCRSDDTESVVSEDVSSWSSHRYTSALARRAGLGLVGENPGPPDSPFTGGSPLSDSLAKQLQIAPRYAEECGMSMFLFGFEEDLFREDPAESGVSVEDYRQVIERLQSRR